MERYPVLLVCLIFLHGIGFGEACNGYKMAIKKIENCAGANQIIRIDEKTTAQLDRQCNLILNGCGSSKAFTTAVAHYVIKKNGTQMMAGTLDICQEVAKKQGDFTAALVKYCLPDKCPVQEMKKCAQGEKISIAKHKNLLSLARGNIEFNMNVAHDTGKSCIKMIIEISK